MRNLLVIVFLFLVLGMNAQKQEFNYTKAKLTTVIKDIEKRFNVHFSYNSSLLLNKYLTYKGNIELEELLNRISENENLKFTFLDDLNVVIEAKNTFFTNTTLLNEIVLVTEYLTSGFNQKNKDGSLIVNPKKLGILPGLIEPDVLQSLQLLPGISSPTESAANLHIRGGTPDQNLILYDGIKIYHQGHMFGMISPFNPYIVESVDIFRSGTKAEYGDRISGVIDIKSINKIPSKTTGGIGVNFLHSDAFLNAPIIKDKLGILISVRRSLNDIIQSPTFNAFGNKVFQNTKIEETNNAVLEEDLIVLDDAFKFTDINAKLIFKPNVVNTFSISALSVKNSLNYQNSDFENTITTDKLDLNNKGVSFKWNGHFNEKTSLSSTIKYSVYNSSYFFSQSSDNDLEEQFSNSNVVNDFGLLSQVNYKIDTKRSLKFGYEMSKFDVDYNLSFDDNGQINEIESNKLLIHNLFSEFNYSSKNLNARLGVRTSFYNEINQFYVEPRFNMDFNLNENLKLKASAEIKNQAISQLVSFEFNDLGLGDSVWTLANNDDIPVLNNKQVSLGFLTQKNGWKLDVDTYYKKIKGLISFTKGFSSLQINEDYATGNSSIIGFDVLLKKRIENFRTWLGYSFSKNEFHFPDIQRNKFPGNFDQRHYITWSNTYKLNKLQFAIGWQFATGKPYSLPTGLIDENISFGDLNTKRLINYHRLDGSVFYDFHFNKKKKLKAKLGLSFINVYNRDNAIDKSFRIDEDTQGLNEIIEQTILGLGFTPNFVFRIFF